MSIISHTQAATFGHFNHQLLVCIWREFSVAATDAGVKMFAESRTKSKLIQLTVIEDSTRLPDSSFREQSAELMSSVEGRLVANACVIVRTGLMGTAFRSAISGVSLLSRTSYPNKTFQGVEEACKWLTPFAELIGLHVQASELTTSVESLRKPPSR